MKCRRCGEVAQVALPSHHTGFCPTCFLDFFRAQVARAIRRHRMFGPDERVLVAVSGGKDSLALLHVLGELGYQVEAVHIDLGIPDSSAPVRAFVEEFCRARGQVLHVVETAKDGLAIPDVKRAVRRPICSVCGKIKRHWFNRFAFEHGFAAMATGHNLDDEAARLFANTLRWDGAYLGGQGPTLPGEGLFVRKVKPLCRLTEFETAAYCFFSGITHWHAPCPYSGGASFTSHKRLLADLEHTSPGTKTAFYENFLKNGRPAFAATAKSGYGELQACTECGFPSSGEVCGVCRVRRMTAGARQA